MRTEFVRSDQWDQQLLKAPEGPTLQCFLVDTRIRDHIHNAELLHQESYGDESVRRDADPRQDRNPRTITAVLFDEYFLLLVDPTVSLYDSDRASSWKRYRG
jgi:hypothetical protein